MLAYNVHTVQVQVLCKDCKGARLHTAMSLVVQGFQNAVSGQFENAKN
jgi:hypothetical protein